ncbi:MAG TPA: condensation domain-containing protein [Puia sp.]|nr:condensation domain-containing protein [Puia sp.]
MDQFAIPHNTIWHQEKTCYEISRYHSFWIDNENMEFKEKLSAWKGYKISGNFKPVLFKSAVSYLLERHESLRSTFLTVGGKYYITVEDAGSFETEFIDGRNLDPLKERSVNSLFYFEDHEFDIQKGPLFLARVIQVGNEEYLASFKLHHAIYDSWSLGIMVRDLYTAYLSFVSGVMPNLPSLKFQYKGWLNFKRHLLGENYVLRKEYWSSLYGSRPQELLLPGVKRPEAASLCRQGQKDAFYLLADDREKIQALAKKYHTSLFVVLQAAFMLYLSRLTGQPDILIGTMLHGRSDLKGIIDQIGFYAYTDLIRTIFDKEDSLDQAILKVKRSNDDMNLYNDYTLLMALTDLHAPGSGMDQIFWNVNLEYMDSAGHPEDGPSPQSFSSPDVRIDPVPWKNPAMVTNMDLKLKFDNKKDKMEIRVLYDCSLYDTHIIAGLMDGYLKYINEYE